MSGNQIKKVNCFKINNIFVLRCTRTCEEKEFRIILFQKALHELVPIAGFFYALMVRMLDNQLKCSLTETSIRNKSLEPLY